MPFVFILIHSIFFPSLSKKYFTEKLLELTYFSPKSHVILQKKADKAVYESPFIPSFSLLLNRHTTLTLLFMSFSVINTSHTFREVF